MINVSIDRQVVENAKAELISQLKSKINQACVEAVCREQYGIEKVEGYECKHGDIVIDDGQVAFKLDFEVRFPMSMLISNGEKTTVKVPENDDFLSELDDGLDEIEPEEIDEATDGELPEIDVKY
jgi:hypothetical protein